MCGEYRSNELVIKRPGNQKYKIIKLTFENDKDRGDFENSVSNFVRRLQTQNPPIPQENIHSPPPIDRPTNPQPAPQENIRPPLPPAPAPQDQQQTADTETVAQQLDTVHLEDRPLESPTSVSTPECPSSNIVGGSERYAEEATQRNDDKIDLSSQDQQQTVDTERAVQQLDTLQVEEMPLETPTSVPTPEPPSLSFAEQIQRCAQKMKDKKSSKIYSSPKDQQRTVDTERAVQQLDTLQVEEMPLETPTSVPTSESPPLTFVDEIKRGAHKLKQRKNNRTHSSPKDQQRTVDTERVAQQLDTLQVEEMPLETPTSVPTSESPPLTFVDEIKRGAQKMKEKKSSKIYSSPKDQQGINKGQNIRNSNVSGSQKNQSTGPKTTEDILKQGLEKVKMGNELHVFM